MGPRPWQLGNVVYDSDQSLVDLVETELSTLSSATDVTAWMDLVRTCRHPQILWIVDYILPSPLLSHVNDLIRSSEQILYGNKRNLILNDGYTADLYQEIAFHTIRAHLRAEEGDFETSLYIFRELLNSWLDKLTLIRKSNLLMHACLAFLCTRNWKESYECLQKHWSLLKYTDIEKRDGLGLWDNEIIIRQVYWFFLQYSYEFRSFYASSIGLSSSDVWRHKKIGLLHLQSYDHSWIMSSCGLSFYNYARELIPELPEYQMRTSTPTNVKNVDFPVLPITQQVTTENLYLQNYQRLLEMSIQHRIDYDKLNDYLFSYLTFKENRETNFNRIVKLFVLMNREVDTAVVDDAKSILDLGCGLTIMQSSKVPLDSRYLGIDISTEVCNQLKKNHLSYIHSSVASFILSERKTFDVCIASCILELLNINQVHDVLKFLQDHCSNVGILIHTGENQIGIGDRTIDINKTIEPTDFWENLISQYMDGIYDIENNLLYFYGRKKETIRPLAL